jgi:group I intron endonuclease
MQGIYIIRNKINGKIYVGQTTDYEKRVSGHLRKLKKHDYREYSKIYNAMEMEGVENFEFIFLEGCERTCLKELEVEWIRRFNSFENGYNATLGGDSAIGYWAGKKRHPETNKKISEKLMGTSWGLHTDRTRKLLSIQKMGNRNGNKKVVCVETGIVFESVKSAAEYIALNPSGITGVLKGRYKTCGGYRWKYFSSQETIPQGSTPEDEPLAEAQNSQFG